MKIVIRMFLLIGIIGLVACASTDEGMTGSSASFSYDADGKTLLVNFASGRSYSYADVPAGVFAELEKAESKGKAYNELVKGKYPSTRIK